MTTTLDAPTVHALWRGPGIYPDLTAESYHADIAPGGSLSSTGARKLLAPSCPAKFRYEQDNPKPYKREFDFGTATHQVVLGNGPDIEVIGHDNYLTKAAKQARDDARAMGAVPLLRHEYEQVQAMADAIRRHPVAGALFDPNNGQPEQSLFHQDPTTGVWLRGRLDWMRTLHGSRFIVPDFKTARDASTTGFTKAIQEHGYYLQAPWYLDLLIALGLAPEDAEFLFVAQEKTAPYLVNVIGISADWLRMGRLKNRAAIETYAKCVADGHWPGYGDEPNYTVQPAWAEIRDTEEYVQ